MRFAKAWLITSKDLKVYLKKRSILVSILLFPIIISFMFPQVIQGLVSGEKSIPQAALIELMNSFMFFFLIGAITLPTTIAAYSIVGEKIEKSLEPLLAAPVTDGEILLGKTMAALVPTLIALYSGAVIYMTSINRIVFTSVGGLFYPNTIMWIMLGLLVPLAGILAIEVDIMISSRVDDVRAAQQYGGLLVLPFAALYVLGEIHAFVFSVTNLLLIGLGLLILDIIFFGMSTKVFKREEILTKWK